MGKPAKIFLFFIFFTCFLTSIHSINPICNSKTFSDPKTLRSDQITVLINGYSESRIHLLRRIAARYSSSPFVASVLILWGNPKTPPETLTQITQNLTSYFGGAPISLLLQSTDSLNSRFLPRPEITTRSIAICDDDIEIDTKSFEFAFKIWDSNRDKLIGFFPRSHDLDLSLKSWIYTVHSYKYSIMLTKLMIMKTDYLEKYSCSADGKITMLRDYVDEMKNCEDILMNFVISDEADSGPVLVEAKRLRDHGDARNEENGEMEMRNVGLSSRRREHRKRRGECIREFHKVLGRMPLRYSYGKLVNSVGEQGLCVKGGKLVFCDQQIF
ncbi:glycosyltransferase family protein 64 C3-like [Papaver somniferum]|uniref:glycosyltransferase family protein 64 C3-like n=1 Tax=Papaver somniferum TaxID=3469 RepID=UPI000E6FC2E2|nr:glycosyltransferase family protein 64 C3-like [Papaver somniferum]